MFWKKSLTIRFIATVLLVLVAGQGLGTFLFLAHSRTDLTTALHERMQRLARQSAGVMAEPILNYNLPVMDAYLGEALIDPDIVAMAILDAGGQIINERSVPRREDLHTFTVTSDIHLEDVALGQMRITYTTHSIDAAMDRNLLVIPAYQLAMLLAVAIILILMFNRHVKNPVARINRALSQITAGDLTVHLPTGADEIGTIAAGVQFLVERLAATISRIDGISRNVAEAIQQLDKTFEQVTRMVEMQRSSVEETAGAVRSASESQHKIVGSTEELLSLSSDNSSALLELRATSEEIAGGAEKLSDNINNSHATLGQLTASAGLVATMANDVTQAIESSSASIEEVFCAVKEVEGTVRESAQLSETTSLVADRGMTAVTNAIRSMESIEAFIAALTAGTEEMKARSKNIGRVLSVIGEVTDQTQLLSLNAQIIAAQAREHGHGFAVVADEMREMAGRTSASTREIETIVSGIQTEIDQVVRSAQEAVQVVQEGKAVVVHSGDTFRETLQSSRKATELARKIDHASREQARGLEMIVSAVEQIKTGNFQVNTAMIEQKQNTDHLLQNLGPIREAMKMTMSATMEQARSVRLITDNIELANRKTADIAGAAQEQQRINEQILQATENLRNMAETTARQVQGNASWLGNLREEIDLLKTEMQQFKTVPQA
jgi:methyl-accepting chemotaxis protein